MSARPDERERDGFYAGLFLGFPAGLSIGMALVWVLTVLIDQVGAP